MANVKKLKESDPFSLFRMNIIASILVSLPSRLASLLRSDRPWEERRHGSIRTCHLELRAASSLAPSTMIHRVVRHVAIRNLAWSLRRGSHVERTRLYRKTCSRLLKKPVRRKKNLEDETQLEITSETINLVERATRCFSCEKNGLYTDDITET